MALTARTFKRLYEEDSEYQEFVRSQMDAAGIDSPQDLADSGRKKFFNWLGAAWDEEDDTVDVDGDVTDALDDEDYAGSEVSDSVIRDMVREEVLDEGATAQLHAELEHALMPVLSAARRYDTPRVVEQLVDNLRESDVRRLIRNADSLGDLLREAGL